MCVFCALMSSGIKAQNPHWESVTPSVYQYWVNAMYEDTVSDLLYVAGGGTSGTGMLVYDGSTLDTLGSYPSGAARAIVRFNDTIYAGGISPSLRLSKWNGTAWDTTGLFANQPVWSMHVYNGELYVGGHFTSIGGVASNGLAKYDGTTWTDISGFPFSYCYAISAITSYNGELYVGGSFGDSASNVMNIARWDGTQWRGVGGGFHGGMDEVSSFEIFNNELYIGGAFTAASGNAGNYITKWNGSVLSDVGGGVIGVGSGNGQIFDLNTFNNSLYAVGYFCYAGGIFTSYIAKWDGTDWCSLGDTFNIPISCVSTLNSDLFIGGGWWILGNDTICGFAKWIGGNFTANCGNTTGINDQIQQNSEVVLYPNPATSVVTFEFTGFPESRSIIIYDQIGREVWRRETTENLVSFIVNEFSAGMYFYRIEQTEQVVATGKLLIQ